MNVKVLFVIGVVLHVLVGVDALKCISGNNYAGTVSDMPCDSISDRCVILEVSGTTSYECYTQTSCDQLAALPQVSDRLESPFDSSQLIVLMFHSHFVL